MVLVVGIPTRDESRTIANVTATIDRGLAAAYPGAQAYIVNADNGSSDGTADVFNSVPTLAKKISVNTNSANSGKGTNVLAILQIASDLDADAVCLIDGDLRSVQPHWLKKLFGAALVRSEATFVTPEYSRSRFEANTTNQLVVPYLRAAFGLDVRQPIGGEFSMNAALVKEALTWQRSEGVSLYGIDVWLTVNSALRGLHLDDVYIGRKVHNPTFPKIFGLGQQVLDTLFRLMMENRPAMPSFDSQPLEHHGRVDEVSKPIPAALVAPIKARAADYIFENWDEIVFTFPALLVLQRPSAGVLPKITSDLWCEILTEAYSQLTVHSFRRVRDHVVGLFPARVITYWQEIEHLTTPEVDEFLENQSLHIAELFANRSLPTAAVDLSGTPELQGGYWVRPAAPQSTKTPSTN